MHFNSYLLAALAGASTALAVPEVEKVNVIVRSVTTISGARPRYAPEHLVRRDTSECVKAASSFTSEVDVGSIPTAPAQLQSDLSSWIEANPSADLCSPSLTGSLSAEYSSYTSSASSWFSKNGDAIHSLYSACSDVPQIQSTLSELVGTCTQDLDLLTGTGASPSSTGKDSAAGSVRVSAAAVAAVAGLVALAL